MAADDPSTQETEPESSGAGADTTRRGGRDGHADDEPNRYDAPEDDDDRDDPDARTEQIERDGLERERQERMEPGQDAVGATARLAGQVDNFINEPQPIEGQRPDDPSQAPTQEAGEMPPSVLATVPLIAGAGIAFAARRFRS
jgi:hypothetical protein